MDASKFEILNEPNELKAATLAVKLMWLDIHHSNKDFSTWEFLRDQYQSYITEPILPEPLIRGRDLLARGFPAGPAMGPLLSDLYDAQLEGRLDEALARLENSPTQCVPG
jgi:poly(A) polymerase